MIEKMNLETKDLVQVNIEKLAELFPNIITEMIDKEKSTPEHKVYKRGINFQMLKQILSDDLLEGDESYEFTWVGKKASILETNKAIHKSLRPCISESKNWDTTGNLYVEGDNLDVLKLLQESYFQKIKMIYIDPPYNTGSDLIYHDKFAMDYDEYNEEIEYYDDDNNRNFVKNEKTQPRFHSDWCSMMYPRLLLARNLLKDDGIIFISIDDNEISNLRKMCDEIFGESNFISDIIWEKRYTRNNDAKLISSVLDHTLLYRKSSALSILREPRNEKANSIYSNPDNDPRGVWTSVLYTSQRTKEQRPNLSYGIKNPYTGEIVLHPVNAWKYSKEQCDIHVTENRLYWGKNGENTYPRLKRFLSELNDGMVPVNLWSYKEVGTLDEGTKEVDYLLGKDVFDYPKPKTLIQKMLQVANVKDNDIILDFFSGSGTTAHALMKMNSENGTKCKYIMIQMPELCNEKSEAFKAGYINICEIAKERIRRAGDKIIEEKSDAYHSLDIGFRVFKVDSSNIKEIYYSVADYSQNMLDMLTTNIKEDRTDLDLLFGCLLEWGLPLSLPHRSEKIENVTVHIINDGDLIACFDENVSDSVIKEIAKKQPLRVVFRDSSFASSPAKINVEEIFSIIAPNTKIKVI